MRALAAALGLLLVTVGSAPAWAAQSGLVRVHNRTDAPITVYVLDVDFFGKRSWRQLWDVAPRSFLDLPDVPAGTMVGAKQSPTRREWPPARVDYPSGRPIFEYVVRP